LYRFRFFSFIAISIGSEIQMTADRVSNRVYKRKARKLNTIFKKKGCVVPVKPEGIDRSIVPSLLDPAYPALEEAFAAGRAADDYSTDEDFADEDDLAKDDDTEALFLLTIEECMEAYMRNIEKALLAVDARGYADKPMDHVAFHQNYKVVGTGCSPAEYMMASVLNYELPSGELIMPSGDIMTEVEIRSKEHWHTHKHLNAYSTQHGVIIARNIKAGDDVELTWSELT
jgi:hypothetical protein